jgi:hypothetical protein
VVMLWLCVKWFAWRLGLVESGPRPLVAEADEDIAPVVHDHALFEVETWRLGACEAKAGANQWFTVFARNAKGEPLKGVEIHWDIEWGDGVVADRPSWYGTTNKQGVCRFMHKCVPTRYSLWVAGDLILSNVRTDLDIDCYCNPYYDPKGGGAWGWRKINKPGFYGYYVYLAPKE